MKAIPPLLVLLLSLPSAGSDVGPGHLERSMKWEEALQLAGQTGAVEGGFAAAKQKRQAEQRLSPFLGNPEVTLQGGWEGDPDPASAGSLTQLSVSLPLKLYGGAEQRAARAETDGLEAQARLQAHERKLEVAAAWLQVWALQTALETARGEAALAGTLLEKMEGAQKLGGVTRLEVAEARTYLAEARLLLLDVEGALVSARLTLNRTLGLPGQTSVRADGPAPSLVPDPTEEERQQLFDAAERHPAVIAQRRAVHSSEARLGETRRSAGWQVSIGAQGGLLAGRYPSASGLLTVSPPLFETGARDTALGVAELAQAEGLLREVLAATASDLADALHEVAHANAVLRVLEQELRPASAQEAELATLLFDNGQVDVLAVLRARRASSAAQRRLALGHADAALAGLRLTLLREALR